MTVLSLLNPLGWFGGGDGGRDYRAKLSGGQNEQCVAGLDGWRRPVSADAALQVSAFWSCVRIIAETIAGLPLQVFQKDGDGGRSILASNPLYGLLHDQPNADFTAMEFWEGVVLYLAVAGNSYVRKNYLGPRLVALDLLRTPLMDVRREVKSGLIIYRYNDPIMGVQEYTDDQVMHIRGFGFGDLQGLSPLTYARRTLGIALASDEAADATFANGMKMSGWFKYKGGNGILTAPQREQARKLLVDPYTGAGNAAKVGILEGDFDWVAASMPPDDAQLLESRRFGVEDVCRWLGVPPILIGHAAQGQTMWGSGVEQIVLGWLAMGLRPYLVRIEQAIRKHLVAPADRGTIYAEYNLDALLRADSKTRTENYARLTQNGLYTRNEVRALENMKAMEGGDDLTVQTNLVPISLLGEVATMPRLKPVEPGADVQLPSADHEPAPEAKFRPDQQRDEQGRWVDDGGTGAATGKPSADTVAKDWQDVKSIAKKVAIGAALVAATALAVAMAPELFALAIVPVGEAGLTAAEAVTAGAQAGRLAWVTKAVNDAAVGMFQSAALHAGSIVLRHLGVDPATIAQKLKPVTDTVASITKAAPADADQTARLRQALTEVAKQSRDAFIKQIGGATDDPGIAESRQTVREAYRAFAARIDALT